MKYSKLRIVWSVAWGIACLLLIVLWVRSYWWIDIEMGKQHSLTSLRGCVIVTLWTKVDTGSQGAFVSQNLHEARSAGTDFVTHATLGFGFRRLTQAVEIVLPHGLLALAAAGLAAATWLPWRFSLRTLLIGMTVAAIGLGWLVYVFKN